MLSHTYDRYKHGFVGIAYESVFSACMCESCTSPWCTRIHTNNNNNHNNIDNNDVERVCALCTYTEYMDGFDGVCLCVCVSLALAQCRM